MILVPLTAPPTPLSVTIDDGSSTESPCTPSSARCSPALAPSCHAQRDPARLGFPALRIAAVARAGMRVEAGDLCDDALDPALESIARAVDRLRAGRGCLPSAPLSREAPECVVEEVSGRGGSERVLARIPSCTVAQIGATCWRIEPTGDCAPAVDPSDGTSNRLRLTVERAGTDRARDAHLRARCLVRG